MDKTSREILCFLIEEINNFYNKDYNSIPKKYIFCLESNLRCENITLYKTFKPENLYLVFKNYSQQNYLWIEAFKYFFHEEASFWPIIDLREAENKLFCDFGKCAKIDETYFFNTSDYYMSRVLYEIM